MECPRGREQDFTIHKTEAVWCYLHTMDCTCHNSKHSDRKQSVKNLSLSIPPHRARHEAQKIGVK
jgi:hypothetical protein